MLIALLAATSLMAVGGRGSASQTVAGAGMTSICEVKADPMKFDGRIIRVSGSLESGHLGIAIAELGHCGTLHVRAPEEVRLPAGVRIVNDSLFDQFWKVAEREWFDYKGPKVSIDALVRILKHHGKPAKRFFVFGQWPIELVPIRVTALEAAQGLSMLPDPPQAISVLPDPPTIPPDPKPIPQVPIFVSRP